MTGIIDLASLLADVPNRDAVAASAERIHRDPGFDAAMRRFCTNIGAHFAGDPLLGRTITDTGSYAVFAMIVASRLTGPLPIGALIALLDPSLASERPIRRALATFSTAGLVVLDDSAADCRQRLLTPGNATLDFFGRWWSAYRSPLADLKQGDGPLALSDEDAAIAWHAIVVTMRQHHGFALTDEHPFIESLMAQRGGYLALVALTAEPSLSPVKAALRFGRSRSQMRHVFAQARAVPRHAVEAWFATEIAFAALVSQAIARAVR